MNAAALLQLAITAAQNAAALAQLFGQVTAAGRTELTPEELAQVRAAAIGANELLLAHINAGTATTDGGGGPGEEK